MPDNKITKAQRHITEAFLSLRKNKHLKEIKVTTICALADVNHSTFYRHYSDVYDLSRKTEHIAFLRAIQDVKDERQMVKAIADYVVTQAQYYRWEETPFFLQSLILFVFKLAAEFLRDHPNEQQLKSILAYMITGEATLILHLRRRQRRQPDETDFDILTDRWREGTCALLKYAFPQSMPENLAAFKRILIALGGKTALESIT